MQRRESGQFHYRCTLYRVQYASEVAEGQCSLLQEVNSIKRPLNPHKPVAYKALDVITPARKEGRLLGFGQWNSQILKSDAKAVGIVQRQPYSLSVEHFRVRNPFRLCDFNEVVLLSRSQIDVGEENETSG